MTRLAAALVAPSGILVVSSCSHLVTADDFAQQVSRGLTDAGRGAGCCEPPARRPIIPITQLCRNPRISNA